MMNLERKIELYLKEFKEKMKIWDVLFRDDRGKNAQALVDLEIRPIDRRKILEKLDIKDYSEGPIEDKLNHSTEMWVFGKTIKNKDIYIKITIGVPGSSVICISFHLAEYKMKFPLKRI